MRTTTGRASEKDDRDECGRSVDVKVYTTRGLGSSDRESPSVDIQCTT
jgi:hypothetical protein